MKFIAENWAVIVLIVAAIAAFVVLAVKGKKEIIYKILYAFVNEAEEMYGGGTGKLKFAEVMAHIYSILPEALKVFITYDKLSAWIEEALAEAKEHWNEKIEAEIGGADATDESR